VSGKYMMTTKKITKSMQRKIVIKKFFNFLKMQRTTRFRQAGMWSDTFKPMCSLKVKYSEIFHCAILKPLYNSFAARQ
jgi:hypothetical protein